MWISKKKLKELIDLTQKAFDEAVSAEGQSDDSQIIYWSGVLFGFKSTLHKYSISEKGKPYELVQYWKEIREMFSKVK